MSLVVGLAACGVSAGLFGSMFVPVRKYDAGDGFFAQWVMSTAILFVGFVMHAIKGFPAFYPLAMIGGACWTIGNACAIPIINRLGMAMGILIWNTANCLTGWASGRFGLFGTIARPPANEPLNYAGLLCVIVGGVIFSRLDSKPKNGGRKASLEMGDIPEKEALNDTPKEFDEDESAEMAKQDTTIAAGSKDRIFAFILSLISGVLYGVTFAPVNYMIDQGIGSKDGLDYVFSHYFGIFLTSTALFLGYCIYKRNDPWINPQIVLPGYVSGLFWGIAQSSFFVANDNLSQAVSFPIITMLPGCIASAWSILYFREITGHRNFIILAVAMTITLCGAAMVGLSKTLSF
ncbi:hypothetical protein PRIPAC_83678 [Pristionchus pacificus]|uniref:Uncharacterized protein n=1 Tax=Pristionchus pacificus TaxID=54126 RepID=A0A2A6C9J6_PRIPA|nr:hypothetical protein PRIPAC_83678 [Pristionchus pacificus]|eukprot:PDM74854.1 hypothetical protein PRIPAC_43344 [Pristionchus pacificus]